MGGGEGGGGVGVHFPVLGKYQLLHKIFNKCASYNMITPFLKKWNNFIFKKNSEFSKLCKYLRLSELSGGGSSKVQTMSYV